MLLYRSSEAHLVIWPGLKPTFDVHYLTTKINDFRYEAASNFVSDSDCQSKSVCELVRNKGQFESKAIDHSLGLMDVAQYFNLPDGILNALDEFQVIQHCPHGYLYCSVRGWQERIYCVQYLLSY